MSLANGWTELAVTIRGYYADMLIGWALKIYHPQDPAKLSLARFIVSEWLNIMERLKK